MSIIKLEIEDSMIQEIGTQTIKMFIERQLSLLRIQYLGENLAKEIRESGLDHQQEVAGAREEAWQEYRTKYLKDVL